MLLVFFTADLCCLPDQITLFLAAALISLSVLTVGLNFLVIITIWKDPFKELKGTANCLILNLAVCDLLVGIPAELLFAFLHWFPSDKNHGIVQAAFLLAAYITLYLVSCASSLTILALAVERLIVISPQLRSAHYSKTTYRAIGILSIWLFAVLLAFLSVLGWDSCHKYRMFVTDAVVVPILILVFACYTRIYLLVRKQLHRDFTTDDQRGELQRLTASGQRRERLNRKERAVAFSVFILVGILTVCWTPALVLLNIYEIRGKCIPNKYNSILSLIFVPPLANPIAYALRTAKFQRALKRIFSCNDNNRSLRPVNA